jgi:hypothetical protein
MKHPCTSNEYNHFPFYFFLSLKALSDNCLVTIPRVVQARYPVPQRQDTDHNFLADAAIAPPAAVTQEHMFLPERTSPLELDPEDIHLAHNLDLLDPAWPYASSDKTTSVPHPGLCQ